MMRLYSHLVYFMFVVLSLQLTFAQPRKSIEESDLADSISQLIIDNIAQIKNEYHKIGVFENYPFQTASLFVLSNVMLNHWQLGHLQKALFAKDSFDLSILFDNYDEVIICDSLNYFDNLFIKIGKYYYGLYGNHLNDENFITISKEELEAKFGLSSEENLNFAKENLLDELIKYNNELDYQISDQNIAAFNELGLMQREIMSIPVLSQSEYDSLYNVASIITDDLIMLLDNKKEELIDNWESINHDNAVSFKQYFICWYKQVVAKVTNQLIDIGYIKIPVARNFNYVIIHN